MVRFLQISIVIMSILIVAGVSIIVYELIQRSQGKTLVQNSASFATIELHKNDKIQNIMNDDDHLILYIRNKRDEKFLFYSKDTGEKVKELMVNRQDN